jgi:quercetin dioxygenase-like cupin family protein
VDGVEHRLYKGDSVHLRSKVPHSMYNDTDRVTAVVSVVTPRLF